MLRRILPLLLLLATAHLPLRAQSASYSAVVVNRPGDSTQQPMLLRSYRLSGTSGSLDGAADAPMVLAIGEAGTPFEPSVVPFSDGSILFAVTVRGRDSIGSSDIRLRWIDSLGADRWNDSTGPGIDIARSRYHERRPSIHLLSDSSIIIIYELHYSAGETGDIDIAAIRLRPDGSRIWSNWISKLNRQERVAKTLAGTGGSVLVVFESRTWSGDSSLTGSDVLIQQIDSTGALGWKDSREPVVIAGSKHLEMHPDAASDGRGGAYIAYELHYTTGDRAGDVDIIAQHVASYGSRLWTNEKAPPAVSYSPGARERSPSLAVDQFGVTVGFSVFDTKTRSTAVGLQRLDTAGQAQWNGGKRSTLLLINGSSLKAPVLVAAPYRGTYVVFEAYDSVHGESNIIAQLYDNKGVGLWNEGNNPVSMIGTTDNEHSPVATLDMMGGLMVFAVREPPASQAAAGTIGYSAVVAALLTPDGAEGWIGVPTPVTLMTSPGSKEKPVLVRYR